MIAAALPPDPPPFYWRAPDRDPYRGSPEEAARLFIAAGLPAALVHRQFAEYASGQCWVRDVRPGETIFLMVFGHGRVLSNVVAEPARWPSGISRKIVECDVDRDGWRYELLRPIVCGNWSEEAVPLSGVPRSAVWGAPFAPPPGFAHWGGTFGGNAGGMGGFGGGIGFGAFAGGWSAGAPGLTLARGLASGPREISFVLPERLVPAVEFSVRHWLRAAVHETTRRRFRFAAYHPISPSSPPGSPVAPVSEPASAGLFACALAMLAAVKQWMRGGRRTHAQPRTSAHI